MRRPVILLTVTVVLITGWFVATLLSDNRPVLGLDLQGGTSIVLAPVKGSDTSTLDTAVQIIRARVDGLGISEPEVTKEGNRINIDLPGVKNAKQAQDLVGKTAELRFRPVTCEIPWDVNQVPSTSTPTSAAVKGSTTTVAGGTSTTVKGHALAPERAIDAQPIVATRPEATGGSSTTVTTAKGGVTSTTVKSAAVTPANACSGATCEGGKAATPSAQDKANVPVILPSLDKTSCLVLAPTVLTGKNVGTAKAIIDPTKAAWIVQVEFKNDDFVKKVAQPYVGKRVAIALDQVVESSPTINQGITGKNVEITGSFTAKQAKDLALVLKYGSLPVQLTTDTASSVSPSLGKDQLRAGIIAGLIGLALVALYMIVLYRILGLVVWIGLVLTGMTLFSLITWLSAHSGVTLTLAGVTGIIVSVGVTVDSYVVYFERLKDEVRTGKTVRSSVDTGFRRAFRTIIAADLVSLIGAAVLYVLTVASVKQFALFLGISTALDLVLAYFFMWPLVSLLSRKPSLVRMGGVGIAAGLDVHGVRA